MFALPENQIAREDSRELSGARGIHLVAHNYASRGGTTCAEILVEWPDDDLVEMRVVDPPIQRGFLRMMAGIGRPQQVTYGFVSGGNRGFRISGLNGCDFALAVGEGEEVAVVGLPRVLTGVLDGGCVAVPEESHCG